MIKSQSSEAGRKLNYIASKYGMLSILILIIIVAGIINPAFLTGQNIINIFKQISATGLLAIGMTFVIISGGVDLSVGSMMSICGVISVVLIPQAGVPGAMLLALLSGLVLGVFNGIFVSATGGTMGSSFIITFGMSTVLGSAALCITNGAIAYASKYKSYMVIGQGCWGVIPITVAIFLIFIAAAQLILKKTSFGRLVYCIGVNEEATRLSGIRTRLIRISVYAISGLMGCGRSDSCLCSRVRSASPTQGTGYELDAIAVVLLGGSRMGGGAGSIWKTLMGVVIMGVLTNALNVVGVTAYPQKIIRGAIILAAVLMDLRSAKAENEMLATKV